MSAEGSAYAAILDRIFTLDPWLVALCTVLFTALETTALLGLVVPGDAVTVLAGSTATSWAAYVTVVLAATVGSLAGEAGGYLVGRLVGPRLRHGRLGRRLGERRWRRAEAYLNGHGARALAAARFVAVVHAVVPLLAGTVRMPFRRFIAWSALGALTWSAAFTGVGVIAGTGYRQYGPISLVATGAVVAALGLGSLVRRRQERRGDDRDREPDHHGGQVVSAGREGRWSVRGRRPVGGAPPGSGPWAGVGRLRPPSPVDHADHAVRGDRNERGVPATR